MKLTRICSYSFRGKNKKYTTTIYLDIGSGQFETVVEGDRIESPSLCSLQFALQNWADDRVESIEYEPFIEYFFDASEERERGMSQDVSFSLDLHFSIIMLGKPKDREDLFVLPVKTMAIGDVPETDTTVAKKRYFPTASMRLVGYTPARYAVMLRIGSEIERVRQRLASLLAQGRQREVEARLDANSSDREERQ